MKSDIVSFVDIGGGLNRAVAPNAIKDNQCSILENFDVVETKISRRGGMKRRLSAPFGATPSRCTSTSVHGIHFFESGDMLFGQYDRFGKQAGLGAVDISSGAEVVPSSTYPWSFVDNNGIVWAARNGSGLWRVTESFATRGGIEAPVPAMTSAHPNPGNVGIGTYRYVYTYATAVGDEGPPSPGNIVVLSTDSEVDLSGIWPSTQPQVAFKRIYRTLPNDAGTYWLVAEIPNAQTSYTDSVPNSELGDPLDFDIIPPSSDARSVAKWRSRLWLHDGTILACSKINRFETFELEFDSFDARGDRSIRALHGWDNRLIVGTTHKLFQVVDAGFDETGAQFNVESFSLDQGCVSHASMKSAEGVLSWLDRDAVYMSSGGSPVAVSTPLVRDILRDTDPESLEYATAYIDPDRTEYGISLSRPADSLSDRLLEHQLVYNWRRGAWTIRKFKEDSNGGDPIECAPTSSVSMAGKTYAAFGTYNAYEMNVGDVDEGLHRYNITAVGRFKGLQADNGQKTKLRKVRLECTTANEDVTIRTYQDGRAAPARVKVASLNAAPNRDLKRFSLGTKESSYLPMCNHVEVEIEYSGDSPFDLNEIHFERDLYSVAGRPQ